MRTAVNIRWTAVVVQQFFWKWQSQVIKMSHRVIGLDCVAIKMSDEKALVDRLRQDMDPATVKTFLCGSLNPLHGKIVSHPADQTDSSFPQSKARCGIHQVTPQYIQPGFFIRQNQENSV